MENRNSKTFRILFYPCASEGSMITDLTQYLSVFVYNTYTQTDRYIYVFFVVVCFCFKTDTLSRTLHSLSPFSHVSRNSTRILAMFSCLLELFRIGNYAFVLRTSLDKVFLSYFPEYQQSFHPKDFISVHCYHCRPSPPPVFLGPSVAHK